MILTETEARTKTCPFAMAANEQVTKSCTASACMGWRWVGWRDFTDRSVFTGRPRTDDDERVGTCGFKTPRNEQ